MRKFKSASHAQRFLSTFGMVHDLFSIGRHTLSAENVRAMRDRRFREWRNIVGIASKN
jgi:putative transposase